jgi:hypothetical protein
MRPLRRQILGDILNHRLGDYGDFADGGGSGMAMDVGDGGFGEGVPRSNKKSYVNKSSRSAMSIALLSSSPGSSVIGFLG